MKIVITCALPLEFNEARNQLGLSETTTKGDIPRIASSGDLSLIYTGIGKVNSIINLTNFLTDIKPDIVIDSGTSGALSTEVRPLDVVYTYKTIEFFSYDFKGEALNSDLEKIQQIFPLVTFSELIVASIEDSVDNNQKKIKLLSSGASIVTWETSSIYRLCNKMNILSISCRGITDSCNENTNRDFKNNRIEACKKIYISIKKLCMGI